MLMVPPPPSEYSQHYMSQLCSELSSKVEPPHPGRYVICHLSGDSKVMPLVTAFSPMFIPRCYAFIPQEPPEGAIYRTRIWLRNLDTGVILAAHGEPIASEDIPIRERYLIYSSELLGSEAKGADILEVGQTLVLEWSHDTTGPDGTVLGPLEEEPTTTADEAGFPLGLMMIQVDLESLRR